ncbi:MAG: hypothetical protein CBD58_01715 [bacterium TMED198]|nr:MAG: hypothetical protein CBD58_01715 [bacterium TMED198]
MRKISYSQYSLWKQCPYQWKIQYVDGIREYTDSIHTMFGTSMHEVIQTFLTVMYNDTAKLAEQLPLEDMLLTRMKRNFEGIVKANGGEMFCSEKDMVEFYGHGVEILKFIKKKRAQYFSKKGYELIGIEVPLNYDLPNNLKFIGYIDIVIKDTVRDVIKIYDIKTSTMGWNKYVKADSNKTDQLLLYKQFYSKQFNHPIDKIEVEYFIVKRKLYENMDFPQKRVQKFVPANGKPSMNKMIARFKEFLDATYDDEGNVKEVEYEKCVGKCKAFNKCKDL